MTKDFYLLNLEIESNRKFRLATKFFENYPKQFRQQQKTLGINKFSSIIESIETIDQMTKNFQAIFKKHLGYSDKIWSPTFNRHNW
jgi:cysteinyl-tRNA synthetase